MVGSECFYEWLNNILYSPVPSEQQMRPLAAGAERKEGWRAARNALAYRGKRLYTAMLIVLVMLFVLPAVSEGLVVSKSSVQKCLDNGEGPEGCNKKLIILMTVPSEQDAATESLRAEVAKVTDETEAGETRELQEPLRIGISRTQAKAAYRLVYWQTFNGKPEELVAQTHDCKDFKSDSATCSVYYDSDGNYIPGSEGFCCECDTKDAFDDTFENERRLTRGKLDCAIFKNKFFIKGTPGTAHCLRISSNWFDAFKVNGPRFEFSITVNATINSEPKQIEVSPAEPAGRTSDGVVLAELLGDFSSYAPVPDFSNKVFMWPRSDVNGSGANSAMLVPRDLVSVDGRECDKIGTSFLAFKNQPNRCQRSVGTCLSNTPQDLLDTDRSRLARGETPVYLLTRHTPGDTEQVILEAGAFKFPVTAMRSSALRLELNADNLMYVQNVASGSIEAATLLTAKGEPATSFEALSGDGYVYMKLNNTGEIQSDFIPSLNCTEGVQMVQSKGRVAIQPTEAEELTVRVAVSDDEEKQRNCTAMLRNSQAEIVDTKLVEFNTSATEYDDVNLELDEKVTADGAGGDVTSLSCSAQCPNPVNIACAIAHSCWIRFFLFVATVIAIIVVLPRLWRMLSRMMSSSSSSSHGRSSRPADVKQQEEPTTPSPEKTTSLGRPSSKQSSSSDSKKRRKQRSAKSSRRAKTRGDGGDIEGGFDGWNHACSDDEGDNEAGEWVQCYLMVGRLPRGYGNLVSPGDWGVLAGVGRKLHSGGWEFKMQRRRTLQKLKYKSEAMQYTMLKKPRELDARALSFTLSAAMASKAIVHDASSFQVLN